MILEYDYSVDLEEQIKPYKRLNPYLYIDIKSYGTSGPNIRTWIVKEDGLLKGILYKYYNSFQLLQLLDLKESSYQEIGRFFEKMNPVMISGATNFLDKIAPILDRFYAYTTGYIFVYDDKLSEPDPDVYVANQEDAEAISEIICSDPRIGGHYTIEQLTKQIRERMTLLGCRHVCIKKDHMIVSHMGTYAEIDQMAVLGGLVTRKDYAGQGYGRRVLNQLARQVQLDGKEALLYCYEMDLYAWYEKLGWKKETYCGKLVRK